MVLPDPLIIEICDITGGHHIYGDDYRYTPCRRCGYSIEQLAYHYRQIGKVDPTESINMVWKIVCPKQAKKWYDKQQTT